jgi:hypothetical protein
VLDFVDHDDVGSNFGVSIWTAVEIRLPELYTWPTRLGVGLAES